MIPDKKYNWFKIADHANEFSWQNNNMCIVEANGKKITLIQDKNELFAVAHKCPHASGIMADGFVDATGNIVCPLHRYRFNIRTGRNVSGEGYFLAHYPVAIKDDGVYVGFEDKSLLNWLR